MFFENVQKRTPDAMYRLKADADVSTNPNKLDLGVGIYRNEQGEYHELKALKDVHCTPLSLNDRANPLRGKRSLIRDQFQPRCFERSYTYLERNPRLFSRAEWVIIRIECIMGLITRYRSLLYKQYLLQALLTLVSCCWAFWWLQTGPYT